MTKGEKFTKKAKCKNNHCSSMSNSAWCDLNNKGNIFKLQGKCPNNKCSCQKLITFTPRQSQLEGNGFKNIMKKKDLRDLKQLGINFLSQQLM